MRAGLSAAQRALRPLKTAFIGLERVRVGDRGAVRERRQGFHAQIDADRPFPRRSSRRWVGAFDGQRGVPASRTARHRHAQRPGPVHASCDVLHAVHAADARQSERLRISPDEAEAAGRVREPRRLPILRLESREPDPAALPFALAAFRPVRQGVGQCLQTTVVGFLAVLPPPRRPVRIHGQRALVRVPPAAQRIQCPFQLPAGFDGLLDVGEPRIVREPGRPRVRQHQAFLHGRRIQRHLDGLKHHAPPSTRPSPCSSPRADRTGGRRTRPAPRSCPARDRRPARNRPRR